MSSSNRSSGDTLFYSLLSLVAVGYLVLIVGLVAADVSYTTWDDLVRACQRPEIRYAFMLSLITATAAAVLSVLVATPIGYLMAREAARYRALDPNVDASRSTAGRHSRWRRYAFWLADAVFDIPIVLPPLVVGLSLLILFKYAPLAWIADRVVYETPAIVLAQFVVACAFAVRTMRATFEQMSDREENVAVTLGASRAAAFWTVVLPQARVGLVTAATISWSRALGEFGPILVFASTTRMKTEVLPTSIYLELQAGDLGAALAISLLMIALAVMVLIAARMLTRDERTGRLAVGSPSASPWAA